MRAEDSLALAAERTHGEYGSMADAARVEHLVFVATHASDCASVTLDGCRIGLDDVRLFDAHARDARRWQPTTGVWLLLFVRANLERGTRARLGDPGRSTDAHGAYAWSERALWNAFPLLGAAAATHPGLAQEESTYLKLYYYFHAALALWLAEFGRAYPRLRYMWRVETDTMFTGRLDQLVALSAGEDADVLLSHAHRWDQEHGRLNYPHWDRNTELLSTVPERHRVWALVSVGRFSVRFVREIMAPRWAAGVLGYEEILLPTTCLNTSGCRLAHFNPWRTVNATRVWFRVGNRTWAVSDPDLVVNGSFPCEDALRARTVPTLELWHPVKQRGCFLDHVEATARSESQYPWAALENRTLQRLQLMRLMRYGGGGGLRARASPRQGRTDHRRR